MRLSALQQLSQRTVLPNYKYTAKNADGQTISETTEAFDKNSLIQTLQSKEYFILKIEEIQAPTASESSEKLERGSPKKKFAHRKVKLQDQLTFARQLCTLLESGITLLRSLEVVVDQIESEQLYKILSDVTRDVEQGSALSEALAKYPKTFNQFWISLVEVGEASGTMPRVLDKLAFYLEQQAIFRSTITSAIMYPAVLFVICMGAVAFFALFVGPRFEGIFTQMGVQLPLITRVLLTSFRIFKTNFLQIVLVIGIGVFILRKWTKTKPGRLQKEHVFYSMPVMGKVYKLIIVERFASQMAILVDTGVPILQALDITERLVDNLTCGKVIRDIKESVRQGELLVAPMQRSRFFPSMALQMILVGEETGELSKMLKHVADFYQDTVSTIMKRFGTLIEPFMLVFMGAVIGVIVLAMFLPMFNIATLGGGGRAH